MAKKLISVWLSLTILLFSSISIFAGESYQGDYFLKNIVINNQNLLNDQSEYPFFMYGDLIYLPLSSEMGKIMGYEVKMDTESRTLKIVKKEISQQNFTQQWMKNNKTDITALKMDRMNVVVDVNGQEYHVDMQGYPILSANNVVCIPLKSLAKIEALQWDSYYEPYSGVYISTQKNITAKSMFNEPESRYNRGLVNYVMQYNKNYTATGAADLVFMFKHASRVYNVDLTKLMAVAHKESTFSAEAVSPSGAVGIMQIMPSTAASQGITRAQLFDPQINIDFSAKYFSERLAAYDGNWTLALSSYNQGSGAVSRGSYTTRYAKLVLDRESQIKSYLKSGGYGDGTK